MCESTIHEAVETFFDFPVSCPRIWWHQWVNFPFQIDTKSKICEPCRDILVPFHQFYLTAQNNQIVNIKIEPEIVIVDPIDEPIFEPTIVDPTIDETRLICALCSESYSSRYSLRIHFVRRHGKHIDGMRDLSSERRTCKKCGKILSGAAKLKDHMSLVHKKLGVQCRHCKEYYKSRKARSKHVQEKHLKDAVLQCAECKVRFKSAGHFKRHVEKQVCQNTAYQYPLNVEFQHKKLSNRYECNVCGIRLASTWGLKRHIDNIHSSYSKCYICTECHRTYKRKEKLVPHKRLCPGKPIIKYEPFDVYLCARCDASHRTIKDVVAHQINCQYNRSDCERTNVFTKEQRHYVNSLMLRSGHHFQCVICTTNFGTRGNCYAHIRLNHMNLEPYFCDCCHLKFLNKSQLRAHFARRNQRNALVDMMGARVHCPICDSRFLTDQHLAVHHQKCHAPLRKCKICRLETRTMDAHMLEHVYEVVPLEEDIRTTEVIELVDS